MPAPVSPVVEYVSPAPAVLPCANCGILVIRACRVACATRGVRLTRACCVPFASRGDACHPRLQCCLRHPWSTSHPRLLLRRPSHPRLWCPQSKVALKEWLRRRKKVIGCAELDALMDLFPSTPPQQRRLDELAEEIAAMDASKPGPSSTSSSSRKKKKEESVMQFGVGGLAVPIGLLGCQLFDYGPASCTSSRLRMQDNDEYLRPDNVQLLWSFDDMT